MTRLRPKNWTDLQHYKRRSPPWVKLHKRLLDDFEFQSLPLASKALAPMLWLLASEDGQGWIDAEAAKLAFRLRVSEQELAEAIAPLVEAGFFEQQDASAVLAEELQPASPESESEKESETESLSADADRCGVFSQPQAQVRLPCARDSALAGEVGVAALAMRSPEGVTKSIPEDFEIFWKTYSGPKNSNKPEALKAWAATSQVRPKLPALLRAVENYARWIAEESRKQKRDYPKQHHSTWLRGEMWNNYGDGGAALTPEEIEANKDRADRLMRRGKYAVSYQ